MLIILQCIPCAKVFWDFCGYILVGGIELEKSKFKISGYMWIYLVTALIALAGIILGDYRTIPQGLKNIYFSPALLITDYIALAGPAAAFLNVALVTFFSALLMQLNKLPVNGRYFHVLGLMAGFAFFGKNIFTMWYILLGTLILSAVKREKFSKYLTSGLLADSLGPMVAVAYLNHGGFYFPDYVAALAVGIAIGFVVPLVAEHTFVVLKGLSLYNVGCTVGFVAIAFVPIEQGFGINFYGEGCWTSGRRIGFIILLYAIAAGFILAGYLKDRENSFKNYKNLLKRPGNAKYNFAELDGMGAVLINMGVNTFICTTYILAIGGDLSGGTIGPIFTIIGFSAQGKHARNIAPIILGCFLGAVINPSASPTTEGVQMGTFLGTTLAPMSGTYGAIAGIITGMLHSFAVIRTGACYAGANLYNNGFCGAVVMTVLYPVFRHFFKENTYSEPSNSMRPKMPETKGKFGDTALK